jgi:hypothetical protein
MTFPWLSCTHVLELASAESSCCEAYNEVALWANQLQKVVVARAHNELVDAKLLAVTELDSQVRVLRLAEQLLKLGAGLHGW